VVAVSLVAVGFDIFGVSSAGDEKIIVQAGRNSYAR
jgi:hypothetical protein